MIDNGIVYKSLCTQCGLCAVICPPKAITMIRTSEGNYFPKVYENLCTICGLCNEVCPVYPMKESDLERLFYEVSSEKNHHAMDLLGYYINTYYGHANDETLRWRAASGGIVTALLVFLFETGRIDGAIVVKMNPSRPLEPMAVLATSIDEIKEARGSKYASVSLYPELRVLIERNETKRVAVIGVPCMIHALQKARLKNRHLREKVRLTIGLLCKQTKDGRFLRYILRRMKINPDEVNYFKFRGDGWPGVVEVRMKSGDRKFHPFLDPAIVSSPWRTFCFSPLGCLTCSDSTAEYADLSTGDAWLPDFQDDLKGMSLFVSRSLRGEKIIQEAIRNDIISAHSINPSRIVESHWPQDIELKKRNRTARIKLFKQLYDSKIPLYYFSGGGLSFVEKIDALWIIALRYFFSLDPVTWFTSRAPFLVHKLLARIPITLNRPFLVRPQLEKETEHVVMIKQNGKYQKENIMFVINGLGVGGAERNLVEFLKNYDGNYNPIVCSIGQGGPFKEEIERYGIPVYVYTKRRKFDISLIAKVAKLIRKTRSKIAVTILFYADIIGSLSARLAGAPVCIMWSAGTVGKGSKNDGRRHKYSHILIGWLVTRVISVSKKSGDFLTKHRWIPKRKIEILHYGVDIHHFAPIGKESVRRKRTQLGFNENHFLIGEIGRLTEQKGHIYLIHAAKELVKRYPHLRFLFIGDGPLRISLDEKIREYGLLDYFFFLGIRRDIQDLLNALDLVVLPSLWEGLPNIILEAMACGKPVVASAVDGTPEAVIDRVTGFLVPPRNVEALSVAIEKLVQDPELLISFGKNARRRAIEEFSIQQQIERFNHLFNYALANSKKFN